MQTKTSWLFPLQLKTREYLRTHFGTTKLVSQTEKNGIIIETFDVYIDGYKRWFDNHVVVVYRKGKIRDTYKLYTEQDSSPYYPSLN